MAAPVAGAVMVIITILIIASLFSTLVLLSNVAVSTAREVGSIGGELRIVNVSITPMPSCNLLVFNITNEGSASVLIDRRTELLVIYVEAVNGTKKYLLQLYGRGWVITNLFIGNNTVTFAQGRPVELFPGMVAEASSCLPLDLSLNDSAVLVLITKRGVVSEYVV